MKVVSFHRHVVIRPQPVPDLFREHGKFALVENVSRPEVQSLPRVVEACCLVLPVNARRDDTWEFVLFIDPGDDHRRQDHFVTDAVHTHAMFQTQSHVKHLAKSKHTNVEPAPIQ
jgi:hypothetical protein